MADKYDAAQLNAAADKVYDNLMCLYGLDSAQHIINQIDITIGHERRRRANVEPKRRKK